MASRMLSTFRLMRRFNVSDPEARLQAMREEARSDPGGTGAWMSALAHWEEGDIVEARRLADSILVNEPHDFRMLVICLDSSIRAGDAVQTREFAQRVASIANPTQSMRRTRVVFGVLGLPLRLVGRGRVNWGEVDVYDQWARWARAHVQVNEGTPVEKR